MSKSKSKDVLTSLKACYLSGTKLDFNKFMRYPTEVAEPRVKIKGLSRKSGLRRET